MATIACPHCSKTLDLPADVAGKTVHCPTCEKAFTPSASAVTSGEPPAKSTNPDGAVTERTPVAQTMDRDADDFGVPRERQDIAKKSLLGVPIMIGLLVAAAGLCGCAIPTIFFLGIMPVAKRQEEAQLPKPRRTDAVTEIAMEKRIHPAFVKGSEDAKVAIAQNKLVLKEY